MRKIKTLTVAMVAAMTFFTGATQAQQSADEEYACTVIICLANPAGPMAVAQCVPAITAYFKNLMKWKPRPFPNCSSRGETDIVRGVEIMKDSEGAPVTRAYTDVTQGGKVLTRTYLDGMDADFKPYPVAQ